MAPVETLPEFKGKLGWEFTSLDDLDLESFPVAAAADPSAAEPVFQIADAIGPNGRDPVPGSGGVIVASLHEALEHVEAAGRCFGSIAREGFFAALNGEHWTDGTLVYVPAGVRVERPIVLTTVQGDPGKALHHRTLVVLEAGAEAHVYDQLLSSHDQQALVNGVVELKVHDGAKLHYHSAQNVNDQTWVFGAQRGLVRRDATIDWTTLGFGGRNGKVCVEVTLAGAGGVGKVTGAYATRGRQHIDYDTLQEHAAPNTTSDLAFRGLVGGRSSAVWRGMIKVDEGAQRTDAFQEARNLLIGKRAHADAIPGLEILADDVRCTHAAAIAQIDPAQIFYLRTRGLSESDASRLIVEGFLAAIVERYDDGVPREMIAAAIERRLETVLG